MGYFNCCRSFIIVEDAIKRLSPIPDCVAVTRASALITLIMTPQSLYSKTI